MIRFKIFAILVTLMKNTKMKTLVDEKHENENTC